MIDAPTVQRTPHDTTSAADLLALLPGFAGTPEVRWRELPWSVSREGDSLVLSLDHVREERLADRANREIVMACGAVLENLGLVAHRYGRELAVTCWPDGEGSTTLARLTPGAEIAARREEDALYAALARATRARMHRVNGQTSPALAAVLRHAARCEGAWLDLVEDDARRALVGDLESEATAFADAGRSPRRILSSRLSSGAANAQFAVGGAATLGELMSTLGASVQPSNGWSAERAASVRGSAVDAPLLGVLGTDEDSPSAWLRAGAALQRVLLHASVQGMTATFLNEPLHHPLLRDALRSFLFAGGWPQAIVRFDFAAAGAGREPNNESGASPA